MASHNKISPSFLYTAPLGSPFATVVIGATAIRASPTFKERRNKETTRDASLKSQIDAKKVAYIRASAALKSHLDAEIALNSSDK